MCTHLFPATYRAVAIYRRGDARLRLRANGCLARLDPPGRWRVVGLRCDAAAADRYAGRHGFVRHVRPKPAADGPVRLKVALEPPARRRYGRCIVKADDTAERVELYRRRIEAGLGVFEPPAGDEGLTRCWCCGTTPPKRSHVAKYGWAARWLVLYATIQARETYCPDCFARFGWPDWAALGVWP